MKQDLHQNRLEVELRLAARFGMVKEVKERIEQGVDVNAKDDKGRTALMLARNNEHEEVARLLIEAGAKL